MVRPVTQSDKEPPAPAPLSSVPPGPLWLAGTATGQGHTATHSRPGSRPRLAEDTSELEVRIRRAFETLDRDGSGTIGKRELYEALAAVGVSGSSHQLLRLFEEADTDRNGQLSLAEFLALGLRFRPLAAIGDQQPNERASAVRAGTHKPQHPTSYPPHAPPHYPPHYQQMPLGAAATTQRPHTSSSSRPL